MPRSIALRGKREGRALQTMRRASESHSGPDQAGPQAEWLALQRQAGNRAMAGLLVAGREAGSSAWWPEGHSAGKPLDMTTRAEMEARFGHEFGDVRVHTDEHAAALKLRLHDEMFVEYGL